MMNLNLLGNPSIEKIIATTLFDSLESLALCSCYDNLTGIRGIGPKKLRKSKKYWKSMVYARSFPTRNIFWLIFLPMIIAPN